MVYLFLYIGAAIVSCYFVMSFYHTGLSCLFTGRFVLPFQVCISIYILLRQKVTTFIHFFVLYRGRNSVCCRLLYIRYRSAESFGVRWVRLSHRAHPRRGQ